MDLTAENIVEVILKSQMVWNGVCNSIATMQLKMIAVVGEGEYR